ncbi:MAG: integrase core domain-containing protein [Thermoleophilia bacterium]
MARDECPNTTEFWSIDYARVVLELWCIAYTTEQLHSPLDYLAPEESTAS